MSQQTVVFVPVGYALTLTAISAGSYFIPGNPGEEPSDYATFAAAATTVLGPFNTGRSYSLQSDNNDLAYSLAFSGMYTAADELLASGDVAGPSSATDNALARFDATTGKLIQNSVGVLSDAGALTGVASIVANGNIASGKSGTAGTLSSFPATASKGSLKLVAVANTNNDTVTISNVAMGQASVISIPDPAAATDEFVLKAANDVSLALKAPLVSPSLTTPALGVVASGDISACTSTSMVLVTPALGVVASGDISACTSTSMTLVTPVLGAASATSVVLTKVNGTESDNAVEASGNAGVITTSALTTAAGGTYAITWTNTAIASTSVILLTHLGGTNTKYIQFKVVPGSGTATLTIENIDLIAALDGTVLLGYMVV
jgi:hypothetical protein